MRSSAEAGLLLLSGCGFSRRRNLNAALVPCSESAQACTGQFQLDLPAPAWKMTGSRTEGFQARSREKQVRCPRPHARVPNRRPKRSTSGTARRRVNFACNVATAARTATFRHDRSARDAAHARSACTRQAARPPSTATSSITVRQHPASPRPTPSRW